MRLVSILSSYMQSLSGTPVQYACGAAFCVGSQAHGIVYMTPCQHQRSEHAHCDAAQVVADLGSLQLGNVVRWLGSGGGDPAGDALRDPSAVLLDTMTLTMRGLGAKVDAEGHSGNNIVREYDEGTQVALTPLQ